MKHTGLFLMTMLVASCTLHGEAHGLKGITSFGVVVESPPGDLGMNIQAISDYVKTLLVVAHLKVITEAQSTGGETLIDVVVTASTKRGRSPRALNVQLEVLQPAFMVREMMPFLGTSSAGATPTIVENAITWRTAQIDILESTTDATTSVKASVGLLFGMLLADYRTENP